jgi:hypothetical protein
MVLQVPGLAGSQNRPSALPTGEHCARGWAGLPRLQSRTTEKSAAPVFARMLTSHQRALTRARDTEPAGQVAARELEIVRIESALRRARELDGDVAAAIEAAA